MSTQQQRNARKKADTERWERILMAGYRCEWKGERCVYRPAGWTDEHEMPICAPCAEDKSKTK